METKKSKRRIRLEKCMHLVTEAVILDLRLTQMWMQGERSPKMIRIMKKSTKRAERRNEHVKQELDR